VVFAHFLQARRLVLDNADNYGYTFANGGQRGTALIPGERTAYRFVVDLYFTLRVALCGTR